MNVADVEAVTPLVLQRGIRVFNGALFAPTEADHVAYLLGAMNPPHGATIIDAGCGVGEMAKVMNELRPDLKFVLLNVSALQLAECPKNFRAIQADFDSMPLPDGSADGVIFSFALCHSADFAHTMAESRRVLKSGGFLFVNDMARVSGDNAEFERALGGKVHSAAEVEEWAAAAGFVLEFAIAPDVVVERLRGMMPPDSTGLLDGIVPTVWKFRAAGDVEAVFNRHERIGFQFSGGRDSTAALYLLREFWPRMTVYHLDSGDRFPETAAIVERVSQDVGVVVIRGDVEAVRADHGLASDLLPADNTPVGRRVSGRGVKLQGRYDCCARTIMAPMHARMVEDGITLLVRGQRDEDYPGGPPLRSGETSSGFEVLYPLQGWSGVDVETYLRSNGLPVADFYLQGMTRASDCMTCTAWWDDGRPQYLKRFHPEQYRSFMTRIRIVQEETNHQAAMLAYELERCDGE